MQAFDQGVHSFQETRSSPNTAAAQIAEGKYAKFLLLQSVVFNMEHKFRCVSQIV